MCTGRSMTERTCGLYRRDNAGMSSESRARNTAVESPRFPGEGSSAQGKSGPKPRTEVVGDGEQAEIPAPRRNEAVTQKDSMSAVMVNCVAWSSLLISEVRSAKGRVKAGAKTSSEENGPCVKKSRYCVIKARTVNRRRWARRES